MHYYFSSWWGVHVIKFVLVHTLLLQFMMRCTNQDKLYHMYTSSWTEVVMHEPGQTLSHVHLTMNRSSNAWTRTNLITWRCTCDKVCPGSCITTSVHDEVYMWSSLSWFIHYYFSSWWGVHVIKFVLGMNQDKLDHMYTSPWTEVVMYEPGQTLSHVHLTMNWSSNVWIRTNFITCTPHHELCDKVCPGSYITTSVHGEVYMWSSLSWFIHYYFSSWWGVHVIKFVLVHALLHVHLIMNWSSNAWTRTNFITCTPHHELK
jgi:hypothetical protein